MRSELPRLARWVAWGLAALVLVPALALQLMDSVSWGLPEPLPLVGDGMPASFAPSGPSFRLHIHVHTEVSHDALGTREEVVRAARSAGLDGVWLSDHLPRVPARDRFEGEEDPWASGGRLPEGYPAPGAPGWNDGVLLVEGREFTLATEVGRVLFFGGDSIFARWDGGLAPFQELVAARPGSFAMVTHGRGPRERDLWRAGWVEGVHGWEALTLSDAARRRLSEPSVVWRVPSALLGLALGTSHRFMAWTLREGPSDPGLVAYDSMGTGGPLSLIGSGNAHPKFRLLGALIPPYSSSFRALSTHVLLPGPLPSDAEAAAEVVHDALRNGRSWISVLDGDEAREFAYVVESDGHRTELGSETDWSPSSVLRVRVPTTRGGGVVIRVLRDGEPWLEGRGNALDAPLPGGGFYRVEVDRWRARVGPLVMGYRLWVASSGIRVAPEVEKSGENR